MKKIGNNCKRLKNPNSLMLVLHDCDGSTPVNINSDNMEFVRRSYHASRLVSRERKFAAIFSLPAFITVGRPAARWPDQSHFSLTIDTSYHYEITVGNPQSYRLTGLCPMAIDVLAWTSRHTV